MILFTLKCATGHEFEAWFRDNAAYDRQRKRSLIACPDCASHDVEKAPMAPHLGRSHKSVPSLPPPLPQSPTAEAAPPVPPAVPDGPPTPAEFRRALQVMRRHVEAHCDDVGKRFPEEARRLHKGEGNGRGIYGEATPAEVEALVDDGIEIGSIPWVPASDA